MEVVSTLNLVSSENEKITACNFQIMAMNYVMLHDFMRGQIESNMREEQLIVPVLFSTINFVHVIILLV